MKEILEVQTYTASSLFKLTPAQPIQGHFQDSPFHFRNATSGVGVFGGAGLYAIFYKDSLIYIGKFLGTRVDWTKGSILAARWVKHLKALTLLGRETSFSQKAWSRVQREIESSESAHPEPVKTLRLNIRASDSELMTMDMGCKVSFEKYLFAEQMRAENGDPAVALDDLDLLYVRYAGSQDTSIVRERVTAAESEAIRKYRPRCNVLGSSGKPLLERRDDVETTLAELMKNFFSADLNLGKPDNVKEDQEIQEDMQELSDHGGEMPKFEERLDCSPEKLQKFVQAIKDALDDRSDAVISYTDTNEGDLRVRKNVSKGIGFVNVATLTLRATKQRLILRTSLFPKVYQRLDLTIDNVVKDRLNHETFIDRDTEDDEIERLVALIELAIDQQPDD